MFAGLICFMLIGFPVAFSLSALGLFFGLARDRDRLFRAGVPAGAALPDLRHRCRTTCCSRSPSSRFSAPCSRRAAWPRICSKAPASSSAPFPGGLAFAVIFVGAILGAVTGTVAASVIAMGMISLPVMLKYGYDMRVGTGVDRRLRHDRAGDPAVAGAHHPLRPARRLGRRHVPRRHRPVDACRSALFLLFILFLALFQPQKVPALPPEARTLRGWALATKVLWGMVPSLVLIFLVLGTIFLGPRHPDRGRRDGRGRRDRAVDAARPLLAAR